MNKILFCLILTSFTMNSWACSLTLSSESLVGTSLGHACVTVSQLLQDSKGLLRRMDVEQTKANGAVVNLPTKIVRVGVEMAVMSQSNMMGTLNIITIKATSPKSAVLTFINGNTMNIQVDENGMVTPNRICVKHSDITQVRGYAERCP